MQLSIPMNAMKAASSGFSTRGGILTSPLMLFRDPQSLLEAATKGYVDTSVMSIPGNAVDKGILSVERLPGFSGDVVKTNGGDQIDLANSGVIAGNYPKVNVDTKGRIIAAYPLSVDDIPPLNWSKIKTNVPTSIDGYNISNAVKKTGDTMTGFIQLDSPPTQSFHLVTKNYADQSASGSNLTVGDVIRHSGTSLNGFLRANGGVLDKNTYINLYNVIGDTFTLPPNSTTFNLPDYTSSETDNLYYFIKY